jgi:hypothetical protein
LLWRTDGGNHGESRGVRLAALPDLDHDGAMEIAVACSYERQWPITHPGEVLVLSGRTGRLLRTIRGERAGEMFGAGLAAVPDQDRDGLGDLLVAIPLLQRSIGFGGFALVSSNRGEILDRFGSTPSSRYIGNYFSWLPSWQARRGSSVATTAVESGLPYQNFVAVLQRDPFLRSDQHELSVSAGGRVELRMEFPSREGGVSYLVAGGLSGVGASALLGLAVPITTDRFTLLTLLDRAPGLMRAQGQLDGAGRADASWTLAPGSPTSLVGRSAAFAAITHANFRGRLSSLPAVIRLLP